jgi:hypothetical protein
MNMAGFNWRQTTVAKAEAAERPIRLNEVAEVATIFGVELTDLLDPAEDAVARSRKELLHVTSMLELSREREAHVETELELAQQKTQRWKDRLDSFVLGEVDQRELELEALADEWEEEARANRVDESNLVEEDNGEHPEAT